MYQFFHNSTDQDAKVGIYRQRVVGEEAEKSNRGEIIHGLTLTIYAASEEVNRRRRQKKANENAETILLR
jgi:hypothetical protein